MPAEPLDRQGLDPDEIASHAFTKTRKGYEVDEVRAYLVGLASKLRETLQQHSDLSRRLAEVERRAADPRDLDEEAVTEMLGEETARLLVDARKAASDIRQRAETEAEKAISEADTTALATREAADQYAAGVRNLADEAETRIREEADQYAAATREAADTETAAQRSDAETYATNLRAEVDAEVAELRSTATTEVDALRAEAGSVLAERTAEAEVAAKAIRDDADGYVARVREEADSYAEATRTAADSYRTDTQAAADSYRDEAQTEGDRLKAEAEEQASQVRAQIESEQQAAAAANEAAADEALAEAREAGRQMVQEAKDYRERVIADLADRRRAARAQLERLASVRDALAVTLTDVVTSVEASHRTVLDTSLDLGEVGDPTIDRQSLSPPEEAPEDEAPDPEAEEATPSSMAGQEEEGATTPSTAEQAEEAGGTPSSMVEQAEEEGATPSMVEQAERSGAVSKPSPPTEAAADADIDGLFARIRADAADPEAGDPDPAEEEGATTSSTAEQAEEAGAATPSMVEQEDEAGAATPSMVEQEDEAGAATPSMVEQSDEGGGTPSSMVEQAERSGAVSKPSPPTAPTTTAPKPEAEEAEAEGADPDQELLDLRDATTDEIERQLARRLKRVLSDEQNEALDLLRRTRGTPEPAEVLPSEDDHLDRYRVAVLEDLTAAERAGAGFYGDAPRRKADVGDVAGDFAAEMMRRVRNPLEKSFEAGDEQEVEDRIRTLYREWKTQRIADVARHYVVVAFSRGVAEAAKDGTEFRWLVDHGGDAAPDCDDNALAGPVAKGTAFPTGDLCPPAHPGCRCLAVLVD